MHLRLVVSNDSPQALPVAPSGTPAERLSTAEKRTIRDTVLALEVRPGVTVEEAVAEYTERGILIDFSASGEGEAVDEKEVLDNEMCAMRLSTDAALLGLYFHRDASPRNGVRATTAIILQPQRLVKVAPSLKPYKDKLFMLSLQ